MSIKHINNIKSKIVGVTMGEEAQLRQLALKKLSELPVSHRPKTVDLVPQPDNEYDPHAIRVMCDHPELGRVQLGFIRNKDCICDTCGTLFDSVVKKCTMCGEETIRRNGLASQIFRCMEADPAVAYYGEILEITGGVGEKENYGMNILIRAIVDKASQPWNKRR